MERVENQENKAEVMERFGEVHGKFISGVFKSRAADLIGNWIPGVDASKMLIEAARGKTSSGEFLSGHKRFAQAVIGGSVASAYALELTGFLPEAVAARSIAAAISKVEFGPEILKEAAERAKNKFPKIAHMLERTADYAEDKRETVFASIKNIKNYFSAA